MPTTKELVRPGQKQVSPVIVDLQSTLSPKPVRRTVDFFPESEDSDNQPFVRRHALAITVLVIAGILVPFVITKLAHSSNTAVRPATLVMVTLPPPPPPP